MARLPVAEVCHKHGIGDATFYTWRSKYGGLEVLGAKRLKALEKESRKLKSTHAARTASVALTVQPDQAASDLASPAQCQGRSSCRRRMGCWAMRSSTSASQACGSTSLSSAVPLRV